MEGADDVFLCKNDDSHTSGTKIPTIEDFEFLKPISRGAFGKVFLGHKKGRPEQLYAIKAMKKADMINKNLTSQVITERDAMAKSVSPFVVQLFYSIQSQQNIFLVMEYMIGGDLKSLLVVAGYFDENMALMYVAEVTLALEYLHSKGIIHRDLKPDNMLIAATGHLKLTDFGLSKFNMSNFNAHDVPMTPRTPKTYSHHVDYYRTPGQILSLKSSLAFSTGKFNFINNSSDMTTPSGRGNSPHNPLSEISNNNTPSETRATPHIPISDSSLIGSQGSHCPQSLSKLNKQMSMRDLLLTQSTSKYRSQSVVMASPHRLSNKPAGSITPASKHVTPVTPFSKPPVKRLMSTLQASLNWTRSTESERSKLQSSVDISDVNCGQPISRSIGMSLSCLDGSPEHGYSADSMMSVELSSRAYDSTKSCELSNSVFLNSVNQTNSELKISQDENSAAYNSSFELNSSNALCTCEKHIQKFSEICAECRSHQKAPSRQEIITDDTPQMHRTDESVWNSYAAKNLRSLRHGSYSEDSEDSDSVNKENFGNIFNEGSAQKTKFKDFPAKLQIKCKPRRLTKTKSFCYPSDEESEYNSGRYSDRVQFARKRSFRNVEQSPVRRTHSADSGLTQELRLLRFIGAEPKSKRSNSLPRTRIRFHSGNDSVISALADTGNKERNDCLKKIFDESKSTLDLDKMAALSADEKRLVEGHSDTSVSESDLVNVPNENCSDDIFETEMSHVSETKSVTDFDYSSSGTVYEAYKPSNPVTDVDKANMHSYEPIISGAKHVFPVVNKMLSHLKKPMVSSLKSESDIATLNSNLSSIFDNESEVGSGFSADMDVSVFTSKTDSMFEADMKGSPSQPGLPQERLPAPSQPHCKPLAPPSQPPKNRRPSGTKKSPTKLTRFASATTCIPQSAYNGSRSRNSSGRSDIAMTPEPPNRNVAFHTSFVKYPQTPKTPLQQAFIRSHSFSHAMKTPFRTPKSVRRAPAPPVEEERILGTPDYLAPEILQQKPHGPSVDWWSLGICMFEFLTGVPPFNDQTPELVFDNICKRDIPWPEGEEALSSECRKAIEALLTMEPEERPRARGVRKMAAFRNIDWHNLLNVEPPFIPEPDNLTDTSYFDARNAMQDLFVSDVDF